MKFGQFNDLDKNNAFFHLDKNNNDQKLLVPILEKMIQWIAYFCKAAVIFLYFKYMSKSYSVIIFQYVI